ncbi:MAG: hypothetical protein NTU48_00725 [Legionellales bacterium]|nr:hypothetical protein [Legionellales bacterium]
MFDRSKKGYHKLLVEDPDIASIIAVGRPTVTYPLPSALGSYTKEGLEYPDNMGNLQLVLPEQIPEFLHNICAAEMPWTQGSFATIFYDADQKPMPGFELFEEALQSNPAAFIDFQLMMLGKRAAQIQIARVGPEPHAMLCDDCRELLYLSQQLSNEFTLFQDRVTRLPASRHCLTVFNKLEKDFKMRWEALIQPCATKYKDEMDFHNIWLNLLAIASIVGLVGLVCKNVARVYQGKNLSFFQFDAAYSKNVTALEQLKTGDFTRPSLDLQNFFTENRDDALYTVQALNPYLDRLKQEITNFEGNALKSDLNHLHAMHLWLSRTVSDFSEEINKIQGTANEADDREIWEVIFINDWCCGVKTFQGQEDDTTHYPQELQAALIDIHYIAEELSQELSSSERYSLYTGHSKF